MATHQPSQRKPDDMRARPNLYKNREAAKMQLPEWDGVVRGPELPENRKWCVRTQAWWQVWRESPQAMLFAPTDWEMMLIAADIHNRMFSPDRVGSYPSHTAMVNMSAELRKTVASVGGSYEDREALGLQVRTPIDAHNEATPAAEETVQQAVDYMQRLGARQQRAK